MNTKGGLAKGKSHKEGGIKATVKSTGQNIEFEGGEIIINKKNVADPKKLEFEGEEKTTCEILSDLNSRNNNGVTMDCDSVEGKKYKYAKGGKTVRGVRAERGGEIKTNLSKLKKGDKFYFPLDKDDEEIGRTNPLDAIYVFNNKIKSTYHYSSKGSKFSTSTNRDIVTLPKDSAYAEGGEVQKSKLQEMFKIQQRGSMREKAEFLKNNPEIFMGKVFEKGGKLQQGEQVFFAIYQDGRRLDDTPFPNFDNEVQYPNGNRSQWFGVQRRFSDAVQSMKNLFQDMELYGYNKLSETPNSTWEIKKITISTKEDKYGDYNFKEKSMFKIKSSDADKLIKEDKFGNGGMLDNVTVNINDLLERKGGNINSYTLDEKVLLSKYNPDGVFPSDEQALMMWQLAMKYSGKIDIENCIIPNSCGADKLISQAPIDLKHIDVFSNTKKDYLINDVIYGNNFLSLNNRIKLYETDKETYRRLDFLRNFIQNPSRFKFGTDCIITNLNDANHVSSTIAEDLVMRNIELADYLKTNGIIVSAYPLIHTITDTALFDKKGRKPDRETNVLKDEFNRKLEIVKVVQMSKDGFSFLNFPIEIIILKKR